MISMSHAIIRCYRQLKIKQSFKGQVFTSKRPFHHSFTLFTAAQDKPAAHKQPRQTGIKVTWYSVLVSLTALGGAYWAYQNFQKDNKLRDIALRISELKDAGIGQENWTLTDQTGKRRSYSEFRGQWLMIYFGFCHCPDICPEELEKLVAVANGIDQEKRVPDITPIFITLDPERDTVLYMAQYCKEFSKKLIGFTGTKTEISKAAKSFRVYFSYGEKDVDGDYIIDHTICMYLINPEGELVDVYERRAQAAIYWKCLLIDATSFLVSLNAYKNFCSHNHTVTHPGIFRFALVKYDQRVKNVDVDCLLLDADLFIFSSPTAS